jgi:hypothetical protein
MRITPGEQTGHDTSGLIRLEKKTQKLYTVIDTKILVNLPFTKETSYIK